MGVFYRLFSLLEDECHKLDMEMASSTDTLASTSDRQTFINFTTAIQKERELMDEKKRLEDEAKLLNQTVSFLTLTSAAQVVAQAVANVIADRKKKLANTVNK